MKILILRNSQKNLDENNFLFANAFLQRGDEVYIGLVNSLKTENYEIYGDIVKYEKEHSLGDDIKGNTEHGPLENFDLVWVMNQPHENIQKDVWQILWMFSQRVPFVNSVEAMMFLNNKNNLGLIVPQEHLLESYIGNDFEYLWNVYQDRKLEKWVLKPTNLGCGADVFLLAPEEQNSRALIQSMTGNTTAITRISDSGLLGLKNNYAILQKYAKEVSQGEKRVIIAGGKVITSHGRLISEGDHRSNFTQGGTCFETELSEEELKMCNLIGSRLLSHGVGYVGLDISYPYLLEFNIVNPGGMYRAMVSNGKNLSDQAIDSIINSRITTATVKG